MNYSNYMEDVTSDINECLNELGTQPVLFIGSGLSKRYFDAPNWIELLEQLQKECPYIPHEVGYYLQDGVSLEQIRSEEHTSELQSRFDLVCRLLLEKKKKISKTYTHI